MTVVKRNGHSPFVIPAVAFRAAVRLQTAHIDRATCVIGASCLTGLLLGKSGMGWVAKEAHCLYVCKAR